MYATRWWHDDDKYQINGDEVTLVKGSSGEYFVNIRDAQIYPDKICTKHHIYEMGQMRFSLRRKEVVQAEVDKLEKENRIRTIWWIEVLIDSTTEEPRKDGWEV